MDVHENRDLETPDAAYLIEILDANVIGMIATDERFDVRWLNRPAAEYFPRASQGGNMRRLLGDLVHEQKLDRIILRHERVVLEPLDGQPPMEWRTAFERLPDGGHLFLVWPADWTDELVHRRADFSMAAFHELRTPLTALLGFAELLEMESEDMTEAQKEAVEVISRTTRQLVRLTDDIFDLTRNSFGELRLRLEPVNLASIVLAVISVHQSEAAGRCHHLDLEIEPDLPMVVADPTRIHQVIDNLVANACIHNPDGTRVEVNLARAGDGIEFEIRDHGRGIGFDDPEEAFRTFRRAEDAVTDGRDGSGIGLPLAKRLVELHRGRLELESPDGGGTRATVWLPLDRENALEFTRPGPA